MILNLIFKVEYWDISWWNGNGNFSGLHNRYITWIFFRFTEWKPEIFRTMFGNSKMFLKKIRFLFCKPEKFSGIHIVTWNNFRFHSVNWNNFQVSLRELEKFPGSIPKKKNLQECYDIFQYLLYRKMS